jgi:hypothetical protein
MTGQLIAYFCTQSHTLWVIRCASASEYTQLIDEAEELLRKKQVFGERGGAPMSEARRVMLYSATKGVRRCSGWKGYRETGDDRQDDARAP